MPNQQPSTTQRKSEKIATAVIGTLLAGTVFASTAYIYSIASAPIAIGLSVNGNLVGYVDSVSDIISAKEQLNSRIAEASDEYVPDITVEYDYVKADGNEVLTRDGCFDALWSEVESDFCEAYMLYIDDTRAAAYTNKEELDNLISSIESQLLESAPEGFSGVQISNRLKITRQLCLNSSVKSIEEINSMINPLAADSDESSDADEVITSRVSSIYAAAPAEYQSSDDDLTLTYHLVNTATVTEVIPYETKHVDDENNYIGTEILESEGSDGLKAVTYEFVYDTDGNCIEQNVISENIITEATPRVIRVGVTEIPDAVPTGEFIWPCAQPKGVSSYYGWRDLYGRPDFHLGIDIPDARGAAINAADGGTVIFAGRTPSYGNNVHIVHDNGFSTLYAHLDTINVSVGDKVYKSQQIGTMGSTGVAYGTHLHFEVRINNQTVDPIKYLPEK